MVKLYYDLIKKGKITLEDVPENWKSAVEQYIKDHPFNGAEEEV